MTAREETEKSEPMKAASEALLSALRNRTYPNCTLYLIWHYLQQGDLYAALSEFTRDSDKLGVSRRLVESILCGLSRGPKVPVGTKNSKEESLAKASEAWNKKQEEPSEPKSLKLYVWRGVLRDYTSGVMFALASSEEEARKLILDKDGYHEILVRDLAKTPICIETPEGFAVWGGG